MKKNHCHHISPHNIRKFCLKVWLYLHSKKWYTIGKENGMNFPEKSKQKGYNVQIFVYILCSFRQWDIETAAAGVIVVLVNHFHFGEKDWRITQNTWCHFSLEISICKLKLAFCNQFPNFNFTLHSIFYLKFGFSFIFQIIFLLANRNFYTLHKNLSGKLELGFSVRCIFWCNWNDWSNCCT